MLKPLPVTTYTFELESLEIVPLRFQTGYLTSKAYHREPMRETVYTLAYPNYEVENSFFITINTGCTTSR